MVCCTIITSAVLRLAGIVSSCMKATKTTMIGIVLKPPSHRARGFLGGSFRSLLQFGHWIKVGPPTWRGLLCIFPGSSARLVVKSGRKTESHRESMFVVDVRKTISDVIQPPYGPTSLRYPQQREQTSCLLCFWRARTVRHGRLCSDADGCSGPYDV